MNSIEERLDRIEKKLDALLAARGGSAGANTGSEMEVDIDGPRGDPEVRFMPKRWTGPDRKGQPISACEPEFLDLLADAYEWFAQRDDESGAVDKNGAPKLKWSRLDAARAWAARLRARDTGSAPAPRRGPKPAPAAAVSDRPRRTSAPRGESFADSADDGEIPF